MSRWAVAAVSAFVSAVLAAGLVGVVAVDGDGRTSAPPSTTTSLARESSPTSAPLPTGSTAAPAGSVAAAVPALRAFVEKERGLRFQRPVQVTSLADAPFEARLSESDAEDLEEVRDAQFVLVAMGLLDEDVDLVDAVRRFSAGAVLGFYDTDTKELVVRGAAPTPFVRAVLVHELTHALEDQHFGLDRDDLGDEAYLGFSALAEGSAGRIEDRYRSSLGRSERREADREERTRAGAIPGDVPDLVQVIVGFPYAYGGRLVQAILGAGGRARLDGAFGAPPASSEHVLDPARYLRGDDPRPVPAPRADREAFDDGEIGQLFLSLMLRAELDDDDADEAAEGWGGDHYVAWKEGARTCVRMTFVMDTPGDTAQLSDALARWARDRDGSASATGTSLRTCG